MEYSFHHATPHPLIGLISDHISDSKHENGSKLSPSREGHLSDKATSLLQKEQSQNRGDLTVLEIRINRNKVLNSKMYTD